MQPIPVSYKYQKGYRMDEFEIDCDICSMESIVYAYDPPDFCPMCGRRAIPILKNRDIEEDFLEDE